MDTLTALLEKNMEQLKNIAMEKGPQLYESLVNGLIYTSIFQYLIAIASSVFLFIVSWVLYKKVKKYKKENQTEEVEYVFCYMFSIMALAFGCITIIFSSSELLPQIIWPDFYVLKFLCQ